jgi:hypothetical protein
MFFIRGINNPHGYLVQNGFSANVSQRILQNQKTHIKMQYLLRLCEILRCTPNDLFDFNLQKNKFIDEDHPLHTLKKQAIPVNINEYFKNASFSDIEELQNLVIQQKQKKGNTSK